MVGKILIVDDVAANRIVMKVKLTAAGYLPLLAHDGAACLSTARAERPDLVLLDLALPDLSGIEVLQALRGDPATRSIPVVIFSACRDAPARAAAFRAGADDFISKPVDDQTLLARIRSFLRAQEDSGSHGGMSLLGLSEAAASFEGPTKPAPARIAIVTERPETAMMLRRDLAPHCADVLVPMSPVEALAEGLKTEGAPDLFLIEADLSASGSGLRLMSDLRSRSATRNAAFCLHVGAGAVGAMAVAYDLGAHDLVTQAVPPQEIALRLSRLLSRKREGDRLRASVQDGLRLAVIDPLTGLHNRRYGMAQLTAICDRATQAGTGFAVMVVDLDRFKSVNDRWGHAAGDDVLVEVADRLSRNLRSGDLLARIGGEEFLIALPDTPLTEAQGVADRLCRAVAETPVALRVGVDLPVTVSIGLALCAGEGVVAVDAVSQIVHRADRALLDSKAAGRNQVTLARFEQAGMRAH
jgi:two-component system cell cycle response regulator